MAGVFKKDGVRVPLLPPTGKPGDVWAPSGPLTVTATGRADRLLALGVPSTVEADARLDPGDPWTLISSGAGLAIAATAGTEVSVYVRFRFLARTDTANVRAWGKLRLATLDATGV